MKVLVTGCAGYIGSVLTSRLLNEGHHVVGVDSLIYNNGKALLDFWHHPKFSFYREDVRDENLIRRLVGMVDVVIPLAALVGAPICEKQPKTAVEVNYEAISLISKHVSSYHRIVYPNTNSGYGQTSGDSFVTEKSEMNPISVYGQTKCEAEKEIFRHPNSCSLRLATVYGASLRMRMDLMVNDFVHKILRGGFDIFEPHFKRNFVGVQDVVSAFMFMIKNQHLRGAFNLGNPHANLSKMELAHLVCDELGVSRGAITVGEGTDPDKRNYVVSNDKILGAGFVFDHPLNQGIHEVARIVETVNAEDLKTMRNV